MPSGNFNRDIWNANSNVVGHPEPEKKNGGIFEYVLASMLKVYLDVF